jgi:uncharacterized protein (DUF488 family)
MQPEKPVIYTIGHSNIEFERFLELLNGIEVLVDVRSTPFSKYTPQFNMESIKNGVESVGIKYIFMEDEYVGNVLGGRPRDDECYENGKIVYDNVMKKGWYKVGISRLIELASKKRTAIMCSEEDPYKCHRHHLITQSLLDEGITVLHIRRDGSEEEAKKKKKIIQRTLF